MNPTTQRRVPRRVVPVFSSMAAPPSPSALGTRLTLSSLGLEHHSPPFFIHVSAPWGVLQADVVGLR